MSLTTAFPFQAYVGDLKTRKLMGHKLGVSLSLLTSEDIARMATVEVRARCGQEERSTPWLPVRHRQEMLATFYDTRMGNFDVRTFPTQACTTCSNSRTSNFGNERCQGHYGFVSMPRRYPNDPSRSSEKMFVINPHLADEVEQLLQAECFFCHRLRVPAFDVERYRQALRLVDAGLMGEALHFLDVVSNARGQEARNRRRRDPNETIICTVDMLKEYVDGLLKDKLPNPSNSEDSAAGCDGEALDAEDKADQFKKPATDIRNQICKQAVSEFKEFVNVCSHCQGISPRITTKNGHLFFYFSKKNGEFNVSHQLLTQSQLREWEALNQLHSRSRTYFPTAKVREHIKQLCQNEGSILEAIFPHMGESTVKMPFPCPLPPNLLYKVFFLDKLLVPPLALRLSSGVQVSKTGVISPDDQTRALSDVLAFVEQIETYYMLSNNSTAERQLVSTAQEIAHEHNLRNLQAKVTEVYTSILDSFAKKEGLFRMHMMGKRVNQACRSVISPDYLVEPNEVLLPRPFARSLTYPEQVSNYSPARMELLKRCVMNGPSVYPGASHLEIRLASGETRFVDLNVAEQTRRQHAIKYFAMAQTGTLIVHRHVLNGDRLIFNRQPTLHKASMMGYRAKVLSGLKTLRFHYVNGKSYNADFDGDEMNIHVPQSIEAKAELECLMDADMNYLVPTSGKPIRGLIQDHIVAGVLLTLRDRMLTRDEFVQLVFNGIAPYMTGSRQTTLTELIPLPAILKPRPLWTGKQLISVLVHFVTGVVASRTGLKPKNHGVNVTGTSLVQPSAYTTTDTAGNIMQLSRQAMDDDRVIFLNSELITGVLCKNQLGPANLSVPHVIHEIYGPHMVGELFGALGRVLTLSLQREGFSMGMDDMCLVQEDRRAALLRELDNAPLNMPDDEAQVMPVIMNMATKLQKEFVPGRMLVPFPQNQLLMMTMSGAKGSNTNTIQMALGLGQQLFDGRRVKRMNSGKTMPAFFTGERRARSLGYAIGRFASGIRPPEYTIHAMAGRDGLIDTAVKTSRSGHLQRCLIKGLESLVVHWDHSVRDSNGSVVQFMYGGDGLDPMKASTLQAWEMAKDNVADLGAKYGVDTGAEGEEEDEERTSQGKRMRGDTVQQMLKAQQQALVDGEVARDPLPPHLQKNLMTYLDTKASFPLFKKVSQVARWNKKNQTMEKLRERRQENIEYFSQIVGEVTAHKRVRAYCDAGEPVGLLAAQAAGEPSTQMTLNTFHSAGSTVTHVTEGIPRLRELLIYASVKKAAVIIPVEKAKEVDETAISKILNAAVAAKVTDCLAMEGKTKGYHYHVDRSADGCHLTVALLFSKKKLSQVQTALCMSPTEHLDSFVSALKTFAKQVVGALDGRQERAGGAGLVNGTVQDPALMDDDIAAASAELEEDATRRDDEEGDDRSTQMNTPAMGAAAASTKPGMKRLRLHEEEDDSDDGASNGTNGDSDDEDKKPAAQAEEDEEEGADALLFATHSKSEAQSYDTFTAVQTAYRNKKFLVSITPLPAGGAPRQGVPAMPEDLFIVNVSIRAPGEVVAVIPDVLERVLQQLVFPTWLPQFESASYTRKAEDPTSGELVFQGNNATIRSVTSFLSLFTIRARAIKVRRARSTDMQDMRISLGVESCYQALYDELDKLFRRYAVDYHHLTLIADSATHRGVWENYNFTGVISHSASPLFQMTFASSKRFLHAALTRGIGDELNSISSAIMVGERPKVGTACVKVTQDPGMLRDVVEKTFV